MGWLNETAGVFGLSGAEFRAPDQGCFLDDAIKIIARSGLALSGLRVTIDEKASHLVPRLNKWVLIEEAV